MSERKVTRCVVCNRRAKHVLNSTPNVYVCSEAHGKKKEANLLRKYFIEHVDYTYIVTVAILQSKDDAETTAHLNRLLKNQEHIASIVRDMKTEVLLKEHIKGAGKILMALRDGKSLTEATEAWYENGIEVADRISSLNAIELPQSAVRKLFKAHLDQTIAYAVQIHQKQWQKAILLLDAARAHMIDIAETIAKALLL